MDIVTLTMNPAVDKSSGIDRVAPERKLRCDKPRFDPGGGGLNVSRAIKKMGGTSLAVFPAGGFPGKMLIDLLGREGLELRVIDIGGFTRENLTVLEHGSGQQFRFGMPGPELAPQEWRACLRAMAEIEPKPRYIVASGSLPPGVPQDFYAQLAALANSRGIRLILDTNRKPLMHALEAGVYLVKPNLGELEEIADAGLKNERDQEHQAMKLIRQGRSRVVVISLGAAGVILAHAKGVQRLRAPTVPIKSKVGAGDSMVAGVALALSNGKNVVEAVQYGIAAGAAAVMTPGTELCRGEDVRALFDTIKG
jgi:6-phosphofructokinase 2